MTKENNKIKRKVFIEETLGKRKYFSYRADLMLYKTIMSIMVFAFIYLRTFQVVFSFLISIQFFLIFTLINKLNLDRKEKEGKKKLIIKLKKEYFNNKINNIEIESLENLVQFFFVRENSTNYKKIGAQLYSTEIEGIESYIKIFKNYDGAEVDKLDIKNFITIISQNNIKNGFIITNNKINDDIIKLIDNINDKLKISIIDIDKLFDLTLKFDLLPENSYFYNKLKVEKENNKNLNVIKNNMFSDKKIVTYVFAAIMFYISHKIIVYNLLSLYISYYFLILTIICILCSIYRKVNYNKEDFNKENKT